MHICWSHSRRNCSNYFNTIIKVVFWEYCSWNQSIQPRPTPHPHFPIKKKERQWLLVLKLRRQEVKAYLVTMGRPTRDISAVGEPMYGGKDGTWDLMLDIMLNKRNDGKWGAFDHEKKTSKMLVKITDFTALVFRNIIWLKDMVLQTKFPVSNPSLEKIMDPKTCLNNIWTHAWRSHC